MEIDAKKITEGNKNMELWNAVKQPPKEVLKNFNNGSYKGTDISPQWRYQILTEKFGACGVGWYYTIDKTWTEQGHDATVMCFASVSLYIKDENKWSSPITGTGGNEIVSVYKKGPRNSDEGFKMAVTDALSVACKMLGIGADIYLGNFDGSKYKNQEPEKLDPEIEKLISEIRELAIDKTLTAGQLEFMKTIEQRDKKQLLEAKEILLKMEKN